MIQATELRLNNYVKYNGIIMSVTAIDSPKPRKEKRFDGKYLIELFDGTGFITATQDQVDGIELTEELLLGSGFLKDKDRDSYYLDIEHGYNRFDLMFFNKDVYLKSRYTPENLDVQKIPHIKHLHDIQNTVYSLSKKELQINLHNQK